jgi:hypothetical protein
MLSPILKGKSRMNFSLLSNIICSYLKFGATLFVKLFTASKVIILGIYGAIC